MGKGAVELSQADATARAVRVRDRPGPVESVVSSMDTQLLLAGRPVLMGLGYSSPAKGVKGTWGGKSLPSLESLTSVNLGSIT